MYIINLLAGRLPQKFMKFLILRQTCTKMINTCSNVILIVITGGKDMYTYIHIYDIYVFEICLF